LLYATFDDASKHNVEEALPIHEEIVMAHGENKNKKSKTTKQQIDQKPRTNKMQNKKWDKKKPIKRTSCTKIKNRTGRNPLIQCPICLYIPCLMRDDMGF
jgi:hypothetical protein